MDMEKIVEEKLRLIFNDEHIIFDKSRFAGGLTNYNYIMNINGTEYVIRQPGGMTNLMIDRKIEKVNNAIASELGLNSECFYFDELTGIKVSVYLNNSRNVAFANPSDPSNVKSVSDIMKKIHSSTKHFPNVFDWKVELDKYEHLVDQLKGEFFYDYPALKKQIFDFEERNVKNTVLVPCHNDTVPENFIVDNSGKTYLVDWEYSGMNDPSWDVAAYIVESKLTEEAILQLLQNYYGELPPREEILKIKCYMMAQDLLWSVWALIRHYSGDDFLDYCYFRYERFQKNIHAASASPDYPIVDMVRT